MTIPAPATAPRLAADTPLFIVMNEGSGRQDADAAREAITEVLQDAGRVHDVMLAGPGQMAEVAALAVRRAQQEGGAVVASGGDGTLNAVAQAVLPAGVPFGVLPQGTFNLFARDHGIPTDVREATMALLDARLQPVQAGLVNERVFLVNASLGLYPQLLEDREAFKARYGRRRWVALWAGAMTLLQAHRPLRLHIASGDAERMLRTPTVFVGNNTMQLERLGIEATPAVQQGHLVAIVLRPVGTLAMLGLMLSGAFGRLGADDDVDSFAFDRLAVRPSAPRGRALIKVAMDGEIRRMRAPLQFGVAPRPLWLMVPR